MLKWNSGSFPLQERKMSDEENPETQNLEKVGSHENPLEVNLEEDGKGNNSGYLSYGCLTDLDHRKGTTDNENSESDDDEQSEIESKTPAASFIILESVSASLSENLEKSLNTQSSCGTRDDVFQDNHLELEIKKNREEMWSGEWCREEAEDSSPIRCSPQSERDISKKSEMLVEQLQKTAESDIINQHGKLIEDRIERFETLHQQPEFSSSEISEQIRAKDTFVVSKGHANEVKEKLEKGKLAQELERNHDDIGPMPPPQVNRKKLADDWLTKVKLLTQTTGEAKVQTAVISSGVRDIWKKRETGGNLNQVISNSEDARSKLRVGKLRPDCKETIFGRSSDKTEKLEKDINDSIMIETSRKVQRTPSYSSCNKNSSYSTQNFVTYTKTGVKTDVKINITPNYPGYQTRGDSYRNLDRYAMIKMLDDLKARVAQLEDENRNLKMALPEFENSCNQGGDEVKAD